MRRKELGGFSGDTQIWCKIDGKVDLYTFKELSDKFNISYGETDLVDANISVLTVQSDKQVIWHKVSKFIKNKNEFLYETTINGHKTFVHDDKHSFILSSMSKKLIKDCKKNATILTSYYMNEYMTVVKNKYYYYGFIYGAWMGSYNTRNEKQIIVADNLEKASLIADAMNKAKVEYNLITDYEKILYTFTFEPFDIFLEDEGKIVAYARLIPSGITYDTAAIGRVLVLNEYRRKGIASELMKRSIEFIQKELKENKIILSAQLYAKELYEKVGFKVISDVYEEVDIPHVKMILE